MAAGAVDGLAEHHHRLELKGGGAESVKRGQEGRRSSLESVVSLHIVT